MDVKGEKEVEESNEDRNPTEIKDPPKDIYNLICR